MPAPSSSCTESPDRSFVRVEFIHGLALSVTFSLATGGCTLGGLAVGGMVSASHNANVQQRIDDGQPNPGEKTVAPLVVGGALGLALDLMAVVVVGTMAAQDLQNGCFHAGCDEP
jgi:hypothetical protein